MKDGLEVLGFVFGVFLIIEVLIPLLSYWWNGYVNQSDPNKHSD
jgi:hypothetical protein